MAQPRMRLKATVLGAPDPQTLGAFYARLLGWTVENNWPDWVSIRPPDGPGLSFQLEEGYVPPVWPAAPGEQQMMSHLDIAVENVEEAVTWAVDAGATIAEYQPEDHLQDHIRVMIDPVGHPFCLIQGEV